MEYDKAFKTKEWQEFIDLNKGSYPESESANGRIKIIHKSMGHGRRDYLYGKTFVGTGLFDVPCYFIDGHIYMSLMPFEVQSMAIPIDKAHGHVIVAGLGMGWMVDSLQKNDYVDKITVYENDVDVIEFYKSMRPNLDSDIVEIIQGDYYSLRDLECDFFLCDIYEDMELERGLDDHTNFVALNPKVVTAWFWGMEKLISYLYAQRRSFSFPSSWNWIVCHTKVSMGLSLIDGVILDDGMSVDYAVDNVKKLDNFKIGQERM